LIALLVCASFLWGAEDARPAPEESRPALAELETHVAEGQVTVSWSVPSGLTADATERILSGIPVTLRHRVELVGRRSVPLWRSKTLGRVVVETTAQLDALTRQYDLERRTRVEPATGEPRETVDRRRTESEAEMRAWLTEVRDLPPLALPDDVPLRRLRVRVESWLGRKYLWYMLPWSITVSAERALE
jgi:hypothetical protein